MRDDDAALLPRVEAAVLNIMAGEGACASVWGVVDGAMQSGGVGAEGRCEERLANVLRVAWTGCAPSGRSPL